MPKPLKEYKQELSTGLFPSQTARDGIFWKDGRNIVFEDGVVKAGLGQYGLFYTETVESITGLKSTIQLNEADTFEETVYYGTPTALYRWNASDGVLDVSNTPFYTGTEYDLWSFARFGNFMAASNGVEPIQIDKRDGAGFVDLVGPVFTWAKILIGTDTQLIAINTSDGIDNIAWCDVDDIEDWTATTINQAGDTFQRNLDSEFIGATKIGQGFAILTKNEIIGFNYIGTPFVFSSVPLLEGMGITGKFGFCVAGALLYGFGRRGIWVSDLASYKRIDSPQIHQFIYGDSPFRFDQAKGKLVCGWHDALQTSVTFYYPTIGSDFNNIGVSYNYTNESWTITDFGRTVVDDSGVFPFALSGDRSGNIFQQAAIATPPQAGEQGFMLLDDEETMISAGYGVVGYGELGYGE